MTAQSIPALLAGACTDIRLAGKADAVGGCQPSYHACPASTQEASAVLRAAAELGLAVLPRGAGTRLHWGAPPSRCDLVVDTRRMDAVLEHAAGDLVVRVQAGVSLRKLADVVGAAGQRLALDPPGSGGAGPGGAGPGGAGPGGTGTIGGLIATGVAGPLRLRYGAPRDLLIGITVVRADGAVAHSGGKVVKNVAGYDLGKLFAGSYGTLGLITEAAFRLHPKPQAVAFVTTDCPDVAAAQAVMAAAADSPLAPSAAELDWPRREAPIRAGILLEGDPAGVAERAERLRALLTGTAAGPVATGPVATGPVATGPVATGPVATGTVPVSAVAAGPVAVSTVAPSWWGRGAAAAADGTVLRLAFWAGELAAVLDAIARAAAGGGLDPAVSGSAAAGVLHVSLPPSTAAAAVAEFLTTLRTALTRSPVLAAAGGTAAAGTAAAGRLSTGPPAGASATVLHAPAAVLDAVDVWGPVSALSLMQAVKDRFDPEHRLAPARFVGGI